MSFFFRGYGLWVRSDLPLVGVEGLDSAHKVDLDLVLAGSPPETREAILADQHVWSVSPYVDDAGNPSIVIWLAAAGAYYRLVYCDGAEFIIDRAGRRVWANWPDSLTQADISSYLLGPVTGFVLRVRGVPCLHASAVSIGGSIVAFAGPSGAGKTTLATAFARMGFPVVSDDILALEGKGSTIWAKPGYPRLRLWSTSIDVLSTLPSHLPDVPMPPPARRHYLNVTRDGYRFEQSERPLTAVYFLQPRADDRPVPSVEPCSGSECLLSLLANCYANSLPGGPGRAHEFDLMSDVAATVRIRRLYPRIDPRSLTALCATVLADLEHRPTNEPLSVGAAVR